MRLSDLNTSMLDDIKSVLNCEYVIRSDKFDKREFIINPSLSWYDDVIEISDGFGFTHIYRSGSINIGSNNIFIYSDDKVVQDFYVGYNELSTNERYNFDRFKVMREIQAATREPLELDLLPTSIRVMIQTVIDQMRSYDFTDNRYDVRINQDKFELSVDMKNLIYRIINIDDYDGRESVVIKAYSFRSLIYEIVNYLSTKYKFDIDPRLRDKIVGVTDLAIIYDFDTMDVIDSEE